MAHQSDKGPSQHNIWHLPVTITHLMLMLE